jgi:hypothetical protein
VWPTTRPGRGGAVDGIVVGGAFVVMELEAIDPVLFLGYVAAAPERLAAAIVAAT